jgi:glycosyltransferase involved in cell wall biosynthesis
MTRSPLIASASAPAPMKTELTDVQMVATTPSELPLVSVIIPIYNKANFAGEAIESVLAQTYPRFEIIAIDDGSTDGSRAVCEAFPTVRYARQENQGQSMARNHGMRLSSGEFLVFLDADDLLTPRSLEAGVRQLRKNPDSGLTFGSYRVLYGSGQSELSLRAEVRSGEHYLCLLEGNFIGPPVSVMYRRSSLLAVGGFRAMAQPLEDYDTYLNIAFSSPVCSHSEVVGLYRRHEGNLSSDSRRMLRSALFTLGEQWPRARNSSHLRRAFRQGQRNFKDYYSEAMLDEIVGSGSHGLGEAFPLLWTLLRSNPTWTVKRGMRFLLRRIGARTAARSSPL